MESFVPWKKTGNAQREVEKSGASQRVSRGKGKETDTTVSPRTSSLKSPATPTSVPLSGTVEGGSGMGRPGKTRGRQSANVQQPPSVDGRAAVERSKGK